MNRAAKHALVFWLILAVVIFISTILYKNFPVLRISAIAVVLGVCLSYVLPQIISAVRRTRPFASREDELQALACSCGVPVKSVRVIPSTKSNAEAFGLGSNRMIFFFSPVAEKYPLEEIRAIAAHELGHHANHDVALYTSLAISIFVCGGWCAAEIVRNIGGGFGIATLSAMGIAAVLLLPLCALSRWREERADAYSLRITGNPKAVADAFSHLMRDFEKQGIPPKENPPLWERLLLTHPPLHERIRSAQVLAAQAAGERSML